MIQNNEFKISWVLDPDLSKKEILNNQSIKHIADTKPSVEDYKIVDAVVIATPPPAHYELVKESLEYGKHVLVSKPVVTNYQQLTELIGIAEEKNLILETDLTYLFSSKIEKLKEIYDKGDLGNLILY